MSHRRRQKNAQNIKPVSNSELIDNSFNSVQARLKSEKIKIPTKKNMKIYLSVTVILLIAISSGLFLFSNFNFVGSTSFKTPQGQNLQLPPNMPSRYDSSLTQNPKLATAYQFATDYSQILSQLICYCGCDNPDHQPYHANNDQCFWTTTGQKETHAENCSTCVYIALTAKALYEANWSISNIRAYIDSQY